MKIARVVNTMVDLASGNDIKQLPVLHVGGQADRHCLR